ncbi:putative Cupin 2 conserved barrel domain protein [metagenome]
MDVKKIKPAFEDERGSIWDYLTDEDIHHIGFLKSKKDAVRGKHYHKEQKQYTLVTKGKIRVIGKNLLENNSQIEIKELCEMEMVFFPPNYYHSIEALEDDTECLVFTSKSRKGSGYEEDTFRIKDINSFELK